MNEIQSVLSDITDALPPLKNIDNLYRQAIILEQQNEALVAEDAARRKQRSGIPARAAGLTTAFLIVVIIYALAGSNEGIRPFGLFIGLAIGALVYFKVKSSIAKGNSSLPAVENNNNMMSNISAEIYRIATENQNIINKLPRDYRYYSAASFFEQALVNGRADSLKEAINLFEEHVHRQKMENNSYEVLEHNRLQTEMLAQIESTSRETARNSAVSAAFSILTFLK